MQNIVLNSQNVGVGVGVILSRIRSQELGFVGQGERGWVRVRGRGRVRGSGRVTVTIKKL